MPTVTATRSATRTWTTSTPLLVSNINDTANLSTYASCTPPATPALNAPALARAAVAASPPPAPLAPFPQRLATAVHNVILSRRPTFAFPPLPRSPSPLHLQVEPHWTPSEKKDLAEQAESGIRDDVQLVWRAVLAVGATVLYRVKKLTDNTTECLPR